jgi:hypothetical protein
VFWLDDELMGWSNFQKADKLKKEISHRKQRDKTEHKLKNRIKIEESKIRKTTSTFVLYEIYQHLYIITLEEDISRNSKEINSFIHQ